MGIIVYEFGLEIRDKKVSENVVADNLSRLVRKGGEAKALAIQESFLDEQLIQVRTSN